MQILQQSDYDINVLIEKCYSSRRKLEIKVVSPEQAGIIKLQLQLIANYQTKTMLLGASNHCSAAAASKNAATDFSIAAIMSRDALSREPSERSLSKYKTSTEIRTIFLLIQQFCRIPLSHY